MTITFFHFRQESKRILTLSLPIIVAQFAQTANGFVDTIMAGSVSPEDLAAVAVGSAIWIPVMLLLVGIMQGLTPIISQLHGADRSHEMGKWVHQGLWLALPLGLLGFWLMRSMQPILHWMDISPDIQPLILGYLNAISWGIPPITFFLALRSFTEGTSRTRPLMIISLLGLFANIPLNYVFIYGKLGLPPLGGIGCGWATAITMSLQTVLIMAYCLRAEKNFTSGLITRLKPPNRSQATHILKVGLPIGLAIFMETSLFCVIALFLASIDAQVVAGHQIALNSASMVFMIPLSLSLALTIRVAFHSGKNNTAGITTTVLCGVVILLLVAIFNSSMIVLFRIPIAELYTDSSTIVQMASELLLFAAAFQISDCLQVGANGVLRGLKDTITPMLLTLFAYWFVGLPLGYMLGLTDWFIAPLGAKGFWIGLIAGLTVAAVLLGWRVLWQFKRLAKSLSVT